MKRPEMASTAQAATRRHFLQRAAAGTIAVVLQGRNMASAETSGSVRITEPFHGAVLNRRHGEQADDGLRIRVSGQAPLRDRVTVNRAPAEREGASFVSHVVLRDRQTEIIAVSQGSFGRAEHRVRVVWDRHSQPRYRFSIDDNSFFLRDIAQKKYGSLFDCFYLKGLRELNAKYGARFVLNIYYTTEDGFELPQFPDRYKAEWRDNCEWLSSPFTPMRTSPTGLINMRRRRN